ncbi:UvrD-helicase domain-containing protein [Candidatus Gracilibacteria bacterium]|nr:UvrD-helicase domain-containing protein [Candidatus Gracilibacteria bacterium]
MEEFYQKSDSFFRDGYITRKMIADFLAYEKDFLSKTSEIRKYEKYIRDEKILQGLQGIDYFISHFDEKVTNINENYLKNKLSTFGNLFQSIEKYPLDILQQKAILNPEKYLLVIAGAGSGKTSTIVGKVKFLIEAKKVKPEEILLISFTSVSAKEMNERIQQKLGLSLDVKTFHKLGLDILRGNGGIKQTILDENRMSDFREYISKELIPEIIENSVELFMQFFRYLLRDNPVELDFESIEDYQKYKGASLEIVENISILGEKMKSAEEVIMANFLFLNCIRYKYESSYVVNTASPEFGQYRPDFFLPEYDIYIEHFGIDKDGNVPKFFGNGTKEDYDATNKKYKDGIKWKKELHKKHKTHLISTYSYENYDNILFKNLKQSLLSYGVIFKKISPQELKEKVTDKIVTESSIFISLILTFLSLYKSSNLDIQTLSQRQETIFTTKYKKLKSEIFLKIFQIVITRYQEFLQRNNSIDFNDMINNATLLIQENSVKVPYKYVIIDEFQDIGVGRYQLIQAILEKNNAELFCVGDDWQSIYRFTGGDLSIFTRFDTYFQNGEKCFINKTYRYPQAVNTITHEFITKNKSQIDKMLESGNSNVSNDVYEILYYVNESEKLKIIQDLKQKYPNIIGLGRTKSDGNICRGIMDFKTVHSSKGLEEDYVVIINGNSGKTGFPVEIRDNFLLDLVLSESDQYEYSEERRLFYVALTRAKNKTFILTKIGKKSIFVKELEKILGIKEGTGEENREHCPLCKTGILIEGDMYKKGAITCNLYPDCDYSALTIMPFGKYEGKKFSEIPESYLTWLKGTKVDREILSSIEYQWKHRNK